MVPISVDKILVAGDLIEAYCVRDIGLGRLPKTNHYGKSSEKKADFQGFKT